MQEPPPSDFISRLRPLVERAGKTKREIEIEAKLGKGALSHMLSGKRGAPRPKTLARLASVLGSDYEHLAVGTEIPTGALRAPVPGLSPTLDQMPGYADVELEVARLEPKIPIAVFQEVRQVRFREPPIPLTADFLRGLAQLLATRAHVVDETNKIRARADAKAARGSTGGPRRHRDTSRRA